MRRFIIYIVVSVFFFQTNSGISQIMSPWFSIPAIRERGQVLEIKFNAPGDAKEWNGTLSAEYFSIPLTISGSYEGSDTWSLTSTIPSNTPEELYDLTVNWSGGSNTQLRSVKVTQKFKNKFYFFVSESIQGDNDALHSLLRKTNIMNPEFHLFCGDNIEVSGKMSEFAALKKALDDAARIPVYMVPGNHDVGSTISEAKFETWKEIFSNRYYSFDYGNYHIVGVDNSIQHFSKGSWEEDDKVDDPPQIEWLHDDLEASMNSISQFLFCHMVWNKSGNQIPWQPSWVHTDYNIRLVLCGHDSHLKEEMIDNTLYLETPDVQRWNRTRNEWIRIIRIDGSKVVNYTPIRSGQYNFSLNYSPKNDGTNSSVTATITNEINEHFEQGLIKFVMQPGNYTITSGTGTITQMVNSDDGTKTIVYVNTDIKANNTSMITINKNDN